MNKESVVLVVDDDPFIRKTLKRVFRDIPVAVIEASNGQEALDLLNQGLGPVLIISDIDMPVMSGLVLAEHVANHHPHLPLILCSGGGHQDEVAKLGLPYFAKGLDPVTCLKERVLRLV